MAVPLNFCLRPRIQIPPQRCLSGDEKQAGHILRRLWGRRSGGVSADRPGAGPSQVKTAGFKSDVHLQWDECRRGVDAKTIERPVAKSGTVSYARISLMTSP